MFVKLRAWIQERVIPDKHGTNGDPTLKWKHAANCYHNSQKFRKLDKDEQQGQTN
jgi:hypothetical protein